MIIKTIKITRPDKQETELMWKLYHAADAVDNRWGGGWSVRDITAELQHTNLDRDQRRFFMRAWQILVIGNGGFGRFMSAFDTYVHNMQNADDDCVAWKPELQKMFNDAELMPVVLEAYEEARIGAREVTAQGVDDLADEVIAKLRVKGNSEALIGKLEFMWAALNTKSVSLRGEQNAKSLRPPLTEEEMRELADRTIESFVNTCHCKNKDDILLGISFLLSGALSAGETVKHGEMGVLQ